MGTVERRLWAIKIKDVGKIMEKTEGNLVVRDKLEKINRKFWSKGASLPRTVEQKSQFIRNRSAD